MSERAAKATLHALVRKLMPSELKRHIDADKQLAQTKSESESYQTRRGDRIIPRFPNYEDRQISPTDAALSAK